MLQLKINVEGLDVPFYSSHLFFLEKGFQNKW